MWASTKSQLLTSSSFLVSADRLLALDVTSLYAGGDTQVARSQAGIGPMVDEGPLSSAKIIRFTGLVNY